MSFALRAVSFIVLATLLILHECQGVNKYSAAANKGPIKKAKSEPMGVVPTSLRELDKPYRMAKLNLLWTKAKHVSNNRVVRDSSMGHHFLLLCFSDWQMLNFNRYSAIWRFTTRKSLTINIRRQTERMPTVSKKLGSERSWWVCNIMFR